MKNAIAVGQVFGCGERDAVGLGERGGIVSQLVVTVEPGEDDAPVIGPCGFPLF